MLGKVGSYTAAATRLEISKSAVSQRIAELEKLAGIALVQRTTRSVRLTEAGQRLVDANQELFASIERNFSQVKDSVSEPRGLVRVTAPVALGRQQIVPRLADFLKLYPSIRVELELSDHLTSLAQEGFDLAIRHTTSAPDTHVAWTLCETQAVLVASEAYLRKNGTPSSPQELSDHACLHYYRRGETPVWRFSHGATDTASITVPPRGSFAANNSEALREAALAGLGIALLPDFSAQRDVLDGKLIQVLPGWRAVGSFGDKLMAIRPYGPYVPKAVTTLVEYLKRELKAGFPSMAQLDSGRRNAAA